MDLHEPKPWHGVREFLKEYLIIVVGVLTALAFEQVVQVLEERDRLFLALRRLEEQSNRLDNVAFRYLEAMRPLGIAVDPRTRASLLQTTRGPYGDCAQDPSPWLGDGEKAVAWLLTRQGEP